MTPTMNADPVALVTGASRGIGEAIAIRLVKAGYRVAGLSTSGRAPEGVKAYKADIRYADQVDQVYTSIEAELGSISILVANAGITRDALLMRMDEESWNDVIETNLSGTYRMVRRAIRPMVKNRFGRIVLISSVSAMHGAAGQVNYAASKSGLIGMARALTREVASRDITVNVVAPGFIETEMTDILDDKTKENYLAQIPAGRPGKVDDVAHLVEFLVHRQSSYISGALIPVDGGLGMGY